MSNYVKPQSPIYNRKTDTKLIKRAFEYANNAHKDQKRMSGEPYIIHPLEVAYILTTLELDDATICAALLHDIIEDTYITREDVEREFGEEVLNILESLKKLHRLSFESEQEEAENISQYISEKYGIDVEIFEGGQPVYSYLLSVE